MLHGWSTSTAPAKEIKKMRRTNKTGPSLRTGLIDAGIKNIFSREPERLSFNFSLLEGKSNNASGGTDCLDTIGPGLEQEAGDQESRRAEGQQLCLKRKAGKKKHVRFGVMLQLQVVV